MQGFQAVLSPHTPTKPKQTSQIATSNVFITNWITFLKKIHNHNFYMRIFHLLTERQYSEWTDSLERLHSIQPSEHVTGAVFFCMHIQGMKGKGKYLKAHCSSWSRLTEQLHTKPSDWKSEGK